MDLLNRHLDKEAREAICAPIEVEKGDLMRTQVLSYVVCIAVTACAVAGSSRPPAQLPPGVYGTYEDNDVGAINQSAWAFASPGRTLNDPVDAIKAVIAVEYLADELNDNPRWIVISPLTRERMREARADLRQELGIAPEAPPQLVVDALLDTAWNLQAGHPDKADRSLQAPVFASPKRTLQVLAALPYIPSANLATSEAASQALSHGDTDR
jgi:hypothetical protein